MDDVKGSVVRVVVGCVLYAREVGCCGDVDDSGVVSCKWGWIACMVFYSRK